MLYSTPVSLGSGIASNIGAFSGQFLLPADTPAGSHSVVVSSIAADGSAVEQVMYFSVAADGTVTAISTTGPTPDPATVLPKTGSNSQRHIEFGVGLAAIGGLLAGASQLRVRRARRS